jgi:hypothetical protein
MTKPEITAVLLDAFDAAQKAHREAFEHAVQNGGYDRQYHDRRDAFLRLELQLLHFGEVTSEELTAE